jgi:hypothetical protein
MTNLLDAAMELENGTDNEIEYYTNIQRIINAGQWSLQGSFGRSMMQAIESGKCLLGPSPAFDYYGNRIPSRTEVKSGTKGSRLFVTKRSGKLYSKIMAEV